MKLTQVYRKSLKMKWLVRIKTKHPNGDFYDGIVLKETKTFIIIASEQNFEFDGFYILAKKYIKGFRDSKYEKTFNEIIRFNNQIKNIRLPEWLNECNKMEDVLREIKRLDIWPLVEILYNSNKESDFYIGSITGGNDKEFGIRSYSATGKWEKEFILDNREIFRIGFKDKYSTNFNNYMKNKKF